MGCCQQRDHGEKRTRQEERLGYERIIELSVNPSQIKGYFTDNCWDILVLQITNTTPIKTNEKVLWAENPRTIGCLAVAYFAVQALKNPNKISKELDEILPFVIESIKKGSDDLRENCLLVLYGYVNIMTDLVVLMLLENKIFNVLLRFFICNKTEMQMVCANICNRIYCGRTNAQVQFLHEGGEVLLTNLIQMNSADKEKLTILIGYMQNILLDEEKHPQTDMCIKLQKLADIFQDIRDKWIGTTLFDQINDLVKTIMFY